MPPPPARPPERAARAGVGIKRAAPSAAAAACFAANCVLCFYLTVWLPHVQRIDLEWNVYCPRVIPTMTVLGLTCGFSLIRGLWPVWGLLTPLILGLVAMACLMSLHFIPIPC